jgi:hypothetical protein
VQLADLKKQTTERLDQVMVEIRELKKAESSPKHQVVQPGARL